LRKTGEPEQKVFDREMLKLGDEQLQKIAEVPMPTRGKEYEQFVYDKFMRLFVDSTVTLNDKILH
jgi:hypothetical protein